jgi:hypothetical protein
MYYVSQNKVYVECPKGFKEVKVLKDEEGTITIEPLKEVDSVKVEFICTLDEIVARYTCEKEEKVEEVEKPKKEAPKNEKRILKK